MSFINPAFLWALPLVAAPIIIHLFNRQKPKPIQFSHIEWIQQAHKMLMPKKRFKEILLMILRALMIALLIFFFSRPVIQTGNVFSTGSQNKTFVILFDQSASMGVLNKGQEALQRSKEQVLPLLRGLEKETKVGFVGFSDQIEGELSPTIERSKVATAIRDAQVMPRPTNIMPAIELAFKMMANQPRGQKTILILTDAAKSGWSEILKVQSQWEGYDPEVAVMVWEIVPSHPNIGFTRAGLALSEEGALQGSADIQKSKKFNQTKTWKLILEDKIVGQGSIEKGSQKEKLTLEARLPDGGFFSGRVESTADAAAFDDIHYVAGRVPRGYNLLIVDGELGSAPIDAESYYLRSALESPRDPRVKSIEVIPPREFESKPLHQFDVIVLANVGPIPEMSVKLRRWLENGGGLFITGGQLWTTDRKISVPLQLIRPRLLKTSQDKVSTPDENSPFISLLNELSVFQWDQIKIDQYFSLHNDSTLLPILKLKNGDPLLALKKVGKGRVLFLTSTLDRAWNNLPSKPLFAPLMRELVASLADPLREQTSLMGWVDESIKIKVPPGITNVSVISPDGNATGGRVDADGYLRWVPHIPGLFQVKTNKPSENFKFAANIRNLNSESQLERISENEIEEIFPESHVEYIRSEQKDGTNVLGLLHGKEVTTGIVIFLIILLIAETILAWPKRKVGVALILIFLLPMGTWAGSGNQFVYGQLKYDGAWDPYPNVHQQILEMVKSMTNIPFNPDRKILTLQDKDIYEYPFLLIKGNEAVDFSKKEKEVLKSYIDKGGFVWIDDTLGDSKSAFAESMRDVLNELYSDNPIRKLMQTHALYRSFFLLRRVSGRRISEKYLEGLDVGGQLGGEPRTAVIFSNNDILGAWMRDRLGQYSYHCEPGGETQRWEAFKLTLNLIYFSLTGTYKKDAIHQPFIERKLGL